MWKESPLDIKTFLKSFLLSFFLCLLTGLAWASPHKYGGQIVRSTTSDPKSFNEIMAKETSTTLVTGHIFEGLTRENAFHLKIEPHLAQSWEVSEDGLIWTFYLRRDVRWNDGVPFTSEDVVFTFNDLIYNPDIPNSARDIFTIEGKPFKVKAIDDYTVQFILPVKFAPFLRGMTQAILPKHKLKKAVEEKKFTTTWGIDTMVSEIVGTGPFKLAQYKPGQKIVFERNPYYWKKSENGDPLPYLNRIIILIVQSQDVQLLKFLEGELDYVGLRSMDYPLIKPDEQKGNFTVYDTGPDFGTNFIVFNQNKGINLQTNKPFVDPKKIAWFTNLDFRRASAHAIDKKKIIEIVLNGLGYPQESAMSPSAGFFYSADVKKYDYDLAKARDILAQSGFADYNKDGIIEYPQGTPVEFNLYTNAGGSERIQIASIIRHDLIQLGMKVNFLALEFNNLVSKLTSSFDWDMVLIGLTGGIEPHFGKNVWSSNGGLHMWYPSQKTPATDWERRIDDIFSLGVQELDENKRKVYYDEFQMIVSDNLPVIYTVLDSNLFAVRNKFGNLRPTSYGGAFHNIEEIYLLEE